MLDEGQELPQLIVIDGGKGQLSSAMKSLETLGLRGRITLIGIAKRLEEIYFPNDSVPLYLDKKSESLRIIQQMRNEAHRFGITHHRNRRGKEITSSVLDGIKGIGEETKTKLLRAFDSPEQIGKAPVEQIEAVVGKARARIIADFFKKETE
jgi:excinuclease ABC subunit C